MTTSPQDIIIQKLISISDQLSACIIENLLTNKTQKEFCRNCAKFTLNEQCTVVIELKDLFQTKEWKKIQREKFLI